MDQNPAMKVAETMTLSYSLEKGISQSQEWRVEGMSSTVG